MRIFNFYINLILLVKHQDKAEMPPELTIKDRIPPWWLVAQFFKHFQLKISTPELNSKEYPEPKVEPIQSEDYKQKIRIANL